MKRKSTSDSSSPNYTFTTASISSYSLTALEGSTQIFTITLTPSAGYSFTSTTNVALYPGTSGSLFCNSGDVTVTQTGASINDSGELVLTLTDSDFSNDGGTTSYLNFVGNAVAATTYTGISVKRSTTGFNGNTSSSWSDVTVYIPGTSSTLANTTTLYSSSSGGGANAGWYAQTTSGVWAYRYWTGSSFSGPTLTGVGTAPGSWTQLSSTGNFANHNIGSAPYGVTNNLCNSNQKVYNKVNLIWSTVSETTISSLTTSSAIVWVVGANSYSGSYAPINFTLDSTYGSGYTRLPSTDGLC